MESIQFKQLSVNLQRIIASVGHQADRDGMPGFLVGGVVRDILLKRPTLDLDFVVGGDAILLAQRLVSKFHAVLKIYPRFGTASFYFAKGFRVDFSSCRKEIYLYPGALPVVSKGTISEDLFRRDFTINAMAVCINQHRYGELIDIFSGRHDLEQKKVKILHSQSFSDDPTRILRAIRFEQRFGMRIDTMTLRLLRQAIDRRYFKYVKPSRYFAEFKKILTEENPVKTLTRLKELKHNIDPNFKIDIKRLNKLHQSLARLAKHRLFSKERFPWMIYFMALCVTLNERKLISVAGKFNFPKELTLSLKQSLKHREITSELSVANLKRSEIYRLLKPLTPVAIFYIRTTSLKVLVRQRIDHFLNKDMEISLHLTGEDLKARGLKPGKFIGEVLEKVLMAKIDGRLESKSQELAFAREVINQTQELS